MLYLLWGIAGALVFCWLLAVAGVFVTGGWIHLMLFAAILMIATTMFTRPRMV